MLCLEVFKNGNRIALAGVPEGSLSASVHCTVPKPPRRRVVDAWVTGFNSDAAVREHLTWANTRRVQLGDEILIRVVDRSAGDPPKRRERPPARRNVKGGEAERCSFCRRWRQDREVDAPSMAGRGDVTICASCVFLASTLVEARAGRALHLRSIKQRPCKFCERKKAMLVGNGGVSVCIACIKRIQKHF